MILHFQQGEFDLINHTKKRLSPTSEGRVILIIKQKIVSFLKKSLSMLKKRLKTSTIKHGNIRTQILVHHWRSSYQEEK